MIKWVKANKIVLIIKIIVINLEKSDLGSYDKTQTKFWVLRSIQSNLKINKGLMVENLFRFNIKLVLGSGTTHKGSP